MYLAVTFSTADYANASAVPAEIVLIDEQDRTYVQTRGNDTLRMLRDGETLYETEAEALAEGVAALRRTAATALARADEIEARLASTKPEVIA